MKKVIQGIPPDFDPRYNSKISEFGVTETEGVCDWVRKFRGQYVSPSPSPVPANSMHSVEDKIGEEYVVMSRDGIKDYNYAKGLHALQEACKKEPNSFHPTYVREDGSRIFRPLDLRENLAARLQDESLFHEWLWTCTGIAYKGGTTRVKIIPKCKELMEICQGFNRPYLKIDYDKVQGWEFDSSKVRCNERLIREEVKKNLLWLAAMEKDHDTLNRNVDYFFDWLEEKGVNKGMGFLVEKKVKEDQLRALSVYYLHGNSGAIGDSDLNYGALFLRVSPSAVSTQR